MKNPLAKKVLITGVIAVLLMIPLHLIEQKVSERNHYHQLASKAVADSWTGQQVVLGPILVLPYRTQWEEQEKNGRKAATHTRISHKYVMPTKVDANYDVASDIRVKGIFKIPVYRTDVTWKLEFSKEALRPLLNDIKAKRNFDELLTPYIVLAVTDPRGFEEAPVLTIEGKKQFFKPGTNGSFNNGKGAHIMLDDIWNDQVNTDKQTVTLSLRGMERLSVLPAGETASVHINSDWPHPMFSGSQLPTQRSVTDNGFKASWNTTEFSNPLSDLLDQCGQGRCGELLQSVISVDLVDPVDIYMQSERSIKYGFLFIALSFIAFFIFEILQKAPIHPVQYTLVGLALAVFYLLLISLTEHLEFALAYFIAASSCIALLVSYVKIVLRSMKNAVMFSTLLCLLYSVLYVVIQAEDFALLMGSVLVFFALAGVMMITRHIDWYALEDQVRSAGKVIDSQESGISDLDIDLPGVQT